MKALIAWLFEPDRDFVLASRLFIRALALIYFAAFTSLALQIAGLAGPDGILPFQNLLDYRLHNEGAAAWWRMPNLFWLNSSDWMLQTVAWLGSFLSLLLLVGRCQRPILILLFILYLSLYHAGQIFMNFQWDTLLLESGFLSIFLVSGPNRLLVFMFHWLLFRLRFMSGVSKLSSGDEAWSSLTTLKYYFETQPLPHVGSWYFHHLPEWMLTGGTVLALFSELIVPFFIFLPRPFRLFAAGVTILMQTLIIASSNHNFINLLTIALCLFLLDDRFLQKWLPWLSRFGKSGSPEPAPPPLPVVERGLLALVSPLIIVSSLTVFAWSNFHWSAPRVLAKITGYTNSYGLGLDYHVFPTMQVQQQVLEIQGSHDGRDWKTYTFRYKPGAVSSAPRFIVPHQPRLDWMIWFVPSQANWNKEWFNGFMDALLRGSPTVLALLENNPFPDRPPRYLRVPAWEYHFTTPEQRKATGNWWTRKYLGLFPHVPRRYP